MRLAYVQLRQYYGNVKEYTMSKESTGGEVRPGRRIAFFIDSFNMYHALRGKKYRQYKWLDYSRLCQCYVKKRDTITSIQFFTAYIPYSTEKLIRQRKLVRALENKGVEIVQGVYKKKNRYCRMCHEVYETWEEKQTDVNIAIELFRNAVQDKYDTALIMTGDSDLIPAIHAVKESFPEKTIGVIIPIARGSKYLKKEADFYMKMTERHLSTSQFPDKVELANGRVIQKPDKWRPDYGMSKDAEPVEEADGLEVGN